jgi:F-type H+-transporting ATPase subunit b
MLLLSPDTAPNVNDLGYIFHHWPFVAVMIAVFFVYGLLLDRVLFKPVMRVLETREQAIKGAEKVVENVKAEEARQTAAFESALTEARRTAAAEREKMKLEALRAADELKEKTRDETRKQLAMSRAALEKEAEMAQAGLSANAEVLARELLSRALRRKVA